MNRLIASAICAVIVSAGGSAAFAADEYNKVPAGDAQYRTCLGDAANLYEGGNETSPTSASSCSTCS